MKQIAVFLLIVGLSYSAVSQTDAKMSNSWPEKAEDISPLLIGEKIPIMKLPDAKNILTDVNKLVAKEPTILVFYRGGWCPYCSLQLSGLQEIKQSLDEMGYHLVAVSTDSPENLAESMGKEKLEYTLLSDADLSVAKQFGIVYNAPENYHRFLAQTSGGKNTEMLLPVPSVFIVDKEGRIQFQYINPDYKQRMDADVLKSVAKVLSEKM